jgi:kinesin family protein 22
MPSSIKTDIVRAKPFDIVEAEPKTPEIHLKVRHVEDLQESGFKVTYFKLITQLVLYP